jgi:vacuolar-type H+-ATPase subunit F/Vma7
MASETALSSSTRLLFFGEEGLADGFRLIGFETYADPDADTVEQILRTVKHRHDSALVVVDEAIMNSDIKELNQARNEGGRVVIIAVPSLGAEPVLHSDVAVRLAAMFGGSSLT